jgi:Zn-finger in ubiquitin-hydrolases and other protein
MAHECVHAGGIRDVTPSALGCEECLKIGSPWVHLRLCRTCGHVGCCDSSPNRHATKHFHKTRHPIIEGYDPPEGWGWCYITRLFWTSADAPRRTTGRSRATFELAQQTTANECACPYRKLSLA